MAWGGGSHCRGRTHPRTMCIPDANATVRLIRPQWRGWIVTWPGYMGVDAAWPRGLQRTPAHPGVPERQQRATSPHGDPARCTGARGTVGVVPGSPPPPSTRVVRRERVRSHLVARGLSNARLVAVTVSISHCLRTTARPHPPQSRCSEGSSVNGPGERQAEPCATLRATGGG